MNTEQLIASLSGEVTQKRALGKPAALGLRMGAVLALYGLAAQWLLGFRPDLAVQFTHPLYVLEVLLLVAIMLTSYAAALLTMYPDQYQYRSLLHWPTRLVSLFAVLIVVQLGMSGPITVIHPEGIGCTLCIASVAILPSAALFILIRRGATTTPQLSGLYAALASCSVGCIVQRLSEHTDSMQHLAGWHYLPTLIFAGIGAWIGHKELKW